MRHTTALYAISGIRVELKASMPLFITRRVERRASLMYCYFSIVKEPVSNWQHKQVRQFSFLKYPTKTRIGYPIITIPTGLDPNGLPVGLSLHHLAGREADLVKWASAIEDLLRDELGGRPVPVYRNHTAKNIPIRRM